MSSPLAEANTPRLFKVKLLSAGSLLFVLAIFLGITVAADASEQGTQRVTFKDCDVCPEMIELPLGNFIMGAPPDEFRRNVVWVDGRFQRATQDLPHVKKDEGPQQTVTIDIPFAIGKNEVTFAEWMQCVDDAGCGGHRPLTVIGRASSAGGTFELGDRDPVVNITYQHALLYVDWLNMKLGVSSYRLPSEAEWEYAARAGTVTRFAQGDSLTSDQANFSGEATEKVLLERRPDLLTRGEPVAVDELDAANAWGIRHMSGNAAEFTLSCYRATYPFWSRSSQWLQDMSDDACQRSIRGGNYAGSMDLSRVAWRGPRDQDRITSSTGFRILKDLR